jgi:hypothetical protein
MEEVLSKFIPNFKLENIERDKEFSKGFNRRKNKHF